MTATRQNSSFMPLCIHFSFFTLDFFDFSQIITLDYFIFVS